MTNRYVGIGGSDGSNGLSWANRKLTLQSAENGVAAGDTVYVGPGVYRATVILKTNGTNGSPITYIGDVSGENTDGVGGIVRLTGSDNDQSAARGNVLIPEFNNQLNYRTFRGFTLDFCSNRIVDWSGGGNGLIFEDCNFGYANNDVPIYMGGANQAGIIIRRCVFIGTQVGLLFIHSSTVNDTGSLVENCVFKAIKGDHIRIQRIGGITIKNCLFLGSNDDFIDVQTALAGGQTVNVNQCIFLSSTGSALEATTSGELVEDYNTFYNNQSDRTNVNVGSNSVTYPPLLNPMTLLDGIKFPHYVYELSEWSQISRIAGTGEAVDDLFGIARPTTSAKKSWGPIQLSEGERNTGTKRTGDASLALADAGQHSIRMSVDGTEITIDIYTRFETNYAGTKPQMIIRQPGQADDTTLATGAVDTWEKLTTTLTPAAGWIDVILRSNNTATSGSFVTFWDDLAAS